MYFSVNVLFSKIVCLKKNSANILGEEEYSISCSQGDT